ncbi:MAG: diacylglycerol/lipid kinase family protein [Rhodanobacteraceae bacterium]
MRGGIEIILNAKSGSQKADERREVLTKVFQDSGRPFHISTATGAQLEKIAEEKAATDCEVLVAGGGDGTICCVGEAALKGGKTLGVIPLGTFNYFAKNLGIPLDPAAAAQVILEGEKVQAPILDLNGRLVLNNSSIGIHPAVLLKRRQLYRRLGRSQLNAYLSVLLTAFQPAPRLRVLLDTDEGRVVRETPLVMICSNAFQMEAFALAGKECLAQGKFALYVARMAGRATIFRLGLRALFRQLRPEIDYEVICSSDATIETLRHHRMRAAVDGELERLRSPLHFRVGPKALCVLAPKERERP